jgi:uncharacterized protein (DUF2235 family)
MSNSPRNLVVLSDGTGNSSAKAQRTNVWRMFEALDQGQTDQIAMYDNGVGTSSNRYFAALGGAFGFGLKRNVLDLYKFLCRNYRPGDRIYGFGFSRGAFTIRILIGLVACEGLVPYSTEEELDRQAAAAYRALRGKAFKRLSPIILIARALRDLVLWLRSLAGGGHYDKTSNRQVTVQFLGLWDTVEAYGMPNQELKRAIDRFVWPMLFGEFDLSPIVARACHALSLDDERTTFHPLLWDEVAEARRVIDARTAAPAAGHDPPAGRITQVWFPGMHSNVGGGYPEDQLSLVSLHWIMAEAQKHGLRLDAAAVQRTAASRSAFARLHDSRKGLASYYRYSPRRIEVLKDGDGTRIWPIVDSSVVMRMAYGSDGYAPISLPHQFWVLDPSGTLVPMTGGAMLPLDAAKQLNAVPVSPDPQLANAISLLAKPDWNAVRLVWDTVFWRRCLYALTVALTLWLVLFPWVPHFSGGVYNGFLRGLSSVIDTFSVLIPDFAQPWKQALLAYPLQFGILVLLIVLSMRGSAVLDQRIHDRARFTRRRGAAQPKAVSGFMLWLARVLRTNGGLRTLFRWGGHTAVPFVFVLLLVAGALFLVNSATFNIANSAGAYCKPTQDPATGKEKLGFAPNGDFRNDQLCWASGLVLEKGQRYLITLSATGNWFDKNMRADPTGFPAGEWIHNAAAPLKRSWSGNWMQTMARIGRFGNDEYLLEPVDDVARWDHACADKARQGGSMGGVRAKISPDLEDELRDCDPTPEDRRVVRSEIVARSDGELFLYVNDAVFGGSSHLAKMFVDNNSGTATVEVHRLPKSPFALE